jgi:hypothetical protein
MYRSKANKNGVYRWVTQKSGGGVRQYGPRQLNEKCSNERDSKKCAKGLQCVLRFRKDSQPGEYGHLTCVEAPQLQQRRNTPNLDLAMALQLMDHNVHPSEVTTVTTTSRRSTRKRTRNDE